MKFLYAFFQKLITIIYDIVNVNKVLRIILRVLIFWVFYLSLFWIFNQDNNGIITLLLVGVSWFWISKQITKLLISKFFSNLDKMNDKPLKLVRFPEKGYIAGVCYGISVYTKTTPIIWRIIAIVGIGGSIWIYPALWIFLKKG